MSSNDTHPPFDVKIVFQSISAEINTVLDYFILKDKEYEQKQEAVQVKADELIADAQEKANDIIINANHHAAEVESQQVAWLAEKYKIDSTYKFDNQIKLDVGGTKYTTSLTTLRRFPDTVIGVMFSGRHALSLNADDGAFFIDRDGLHFRHILNFLRMPEGFVLNLSEAHMAELTREAEYYGLRELMFPIPEFTPAADVTVMDSQYGQSFIISQDDQKLWFVKYAGNRSHVVHGGMLTCCSTKKLLHVCSKCKTGGVFGYITSNNSEELPVWFTSFFTNREVDSAQPLYTWDNLCPSCKQH